MPNKLELVITSSCDPEAYRAIHNDTIVGFLRLRWGYFAVYLYDQQIYDARIGHKEINSFPTEKMRYYYLGIAKDKILKKIQKGNEQWKE
jgi:hypothetical protein